MKCILSLKNKTIILSISHHFYSKNLINLELYLSYPQKPFRKFKQVNNNILNCERNVRMKKLKS